jgi:hypothetical protein
MNTIIYTNGEQKEQVDLFLAEAKSVTSFQDKYAANLIGMGASRAAYALYYFELPGGFYLLLDFMNSKLFEFSVVSKPHLSQLYRLVFPLRNRDGIKQFD